MENGQNNEKQDVSSEKKKKEYSSRDIRGLKNNIEELNETIEKSVSWKHAFLLGMLRGLGAVVGATMIASLVFYILAHAVETFEDVPVIGDALESIRLQIVPEEEDPLR